MHLDSHETELLLPVQIFSRIRVFSAKTLKPLAVLQYHREGLYCLGFANVELKLKDRIENDVKTTMDDQNEDISVPSSSQTSQDTDTRNPPLSMVTDDDSNIQDSDVSEDSEDSECNDDDSDLEASLKSRAEWSRRHWLAAGGKENRISLWEIY